MICNTWLYTVAVTLHSHASFLLLAKIYVDLLHSQVCVFTWYILLLCYIHFHSRHHQVFNSRPNLTRHLTAVHGCRPPSPRKLKPRSPFYIRALPLTKLARRLCQDLYNKVHHCRVVGEALNIQEIRAQCKFPTGQSFHNFLEMSCLLNSCMKSLLPNIKSYQCSFTNLCQFGRKRATESVQTHGFFKMYSNLESYFEDLERVNTLKISRKLTFYRCN